MKILKSTSPLIVLALLLITNVIYSKPISKPPHKLIRVGVYDNPPKIAIDRDGQVSGFWNDLMVYIAQKEDWKIEYVPGTWNECLLNLQNGSIDIMPDVAFTQTREKQYAFSDESIIVSWTRLYVQENNSDIESFADLNLKKVAALSNSVNLNGPDGLLELVHTFNMSVTVIELNNYATVFKAIENGEADAGIVNRNFGNKFAKDYAVRETPIIFQPISMKFAFPRTAIHTPELLKRINSQIKKMKQDNNSIYYKLLKKYFETEIAEKEIKTLPGWFKPALEIGIGIILFLVLVMFSARIQIKRQTKEIRNQNDALVDEKERLTVTLNSIGDGVIATDNTGQITLFNKIAEHLTGWKAREAIQKPLSDVFTIVNAKTGETCPDPVSKVLSSGKIIGLENHTELIAKDGTHRSIADSGAPIYNKENRIIGVILVFRDVTEKEKSKAAMLKIKKLESVGVLAGGIAHDFNNILASILGYIELAELSLKPTSEAYPNLEAAKKASLRATGLTQQLLTFSKGGAPIRKTTSIRKIIIDSANFVLHGSNVSCQYKFADDLYLVDIDAGQISQVIQNLVLNAKYAMPDGGIIKIACLNIPNIKTENIFTLPGKAYIRINVQDDGCGIDKEHLENIFDPYFTTKENGSGLGLAITHSIISKHDGLIDVESNIGKGTMFNLYLPISEKQSMSVLTNANDTLKTTIAHILFMDDDKLVRDIAKKMLNYFGHEVYLAEDGEKAIEIYIQKDQDKEPIDIIIMDLTIPGGMGGKEAIKGILKINQNAKVVVTSGYSNDPVLSNYKQFGFKAAIAKPFVLDDLQRVILQVLS